jgi:hypothetical protein
MVHLKWWIGCTEKLNNTRCLKPSPSIVWCGWHDTKDGAMVQRIDKNTNDRNVIDVPMIHSVPFNEARRAATASPATSSNSPPRCRRPRIVDGEAGQVVDRVRKLCVFPVYQHGDGPDDVSCSEVTVGRHQRDREGGAMHRELPRARMVCACPVAIDTGSNAPKPGGGVIACKRRREAPSRAAG